MTNARYIVALLLIPLVMGIAPMKGPTDLGNEAFEAGRYKEALEHYKDAVRDDPDSAETHYNLGNAYYRLGDYDSALEEYLKAGRLDPEMADAFFNSGNASFMQKRFEDALKLYERADEIRPDDPDTLHNIELTKKLIEKLKKKQEGEGKGGKEGDEDKEDGRLGIGKRPVPKLTDRDVASLLDRQAKEEKKLRGYFRPGRSERDSGMEAEMDRLLRSLGIEPPRRPSDPSAPQVEKDW